MCRMSRASGSDRREIAPNSYRVPADGLYTMSVFMQNPYSDCGIDADDHINDGVELRVTAQRGANSGNLFGHSTADCWIDPGFY
jgi:hypothetical protein